MEEEIIVGQEDVEVYAALEDTSRPFVGRWHRLVSRTNWEKGRIISQWRCALQEAGAPASAYSDEAWSRWVGGVSPQHVGRLRRVYERFGQVVDQYPGLYWSHFLAALDWLDAEMWLEGAVQNRWSVARMQTERANTLGLSGLPRDGAPLEEEIDEDAAVASDARPEPLSASEDELRPTRKELENIESSEEISEFSESAFMEESYESGMSDSGVSALETGPPAFADLPAMPEDVAEAFEAFKLAIVRHKLAGWQEIPCRDVVNILEALKQFALAPSEG